MNKCYFCGGRQTEQLTTFVYEDQGQVWIVRNVPAYVCEQCGEREYRQEITRKILALLQRPPRKTEMVSVPAYDFAVA
jgi:YgiT-type zinc finger domain-containing protein